MKQPWLEGEFADVIDLLKFELRELNLNLKEADLAKETLGQLNDIIENLDELFLLVIVGEVKSGKSSSINALFGEKICPEGVIPVTDKINVLKYGERPIEKYIGEFMVERYLTFDQLKNMHIVDTPGTNSIVHQHQEITENFIPKSDLVMFCSSVDRPYSQTEKEFLSLISKDWRKRVFFLLTKIDIKDSEDDIEEVVNYISTNVKNDFNFTPLIFPCSPKMAFKARQTNDAELLKKSRFDKIDEYIFKTLSDREKLELKLLSPIESALNICGKSLEEFNLRMSIVTDHTKTIENVRKLVNSQADAILEGYSRYILEISNLLILVSNRAITYLEEKISLRNFRELMDREKFKLEFNKIVLQEFEKALWDIMQRATDGVVRREMTIWSDAFNLYNEWVTLQKYKHDAIGKVSAEFLYNRDKIVDGVRLQFDSSMNEFNYDRQCSRIFELVNKGLMQTFGVMILGAGGGAIAGALAMSGVGAIVGGIVGAFFIGGLGTVILPKKRKKAIKEFKKNFAQLKTEIIKVLQDNIKSEIDTLKKQIEDQLEPAFQYFTKLKDQTTVLIEKIAGKEKSLVKLKSEIEELIEGTYQASLKLEEQAETEESEPEQDEEIDETEEESVETEETDAENVD